MPGRVPCRQLPIVAHNEVATAVGVFRARRTAADMDIDSVEINILRIADRRFDVAQRIIVGLEATTSA